MNKKNEDYEKEISKGLTSRYRFAFAVLTISLIFTLPLMSIETFEDILILIFLVLFYCFFGQLFITDFIKISKKINTIFYLSYLVILLFLIIGFLTVEQTDILWYAVISFVVVSVKAYLEFKET